MSFLRLRSGPPVSRLRLAPSIPASTSFAPAFIHVATNDAPASSKRFSRALSTEAAPSETSEPSVDPVSVTAQPAQSQIPKKRAQRSYVVPRGIAPPPPTDPLLSYFTSLMMKNGKRHLAARNLANTLNAIHVLTRSPPLPILRAAVEAASPEVKVVSQKQRNKNVMSPRALSEKQRVGQAIRWILDVSRRRQDFLLEQRLAKEMVAIVNGSSDVLKRRDEVHNLALANRANASVRL